MLAWQTLFEMYQTNPDRVEEQIPGRVDGREIMHWRPYAPAGLDIFDRPMGFYRIRPERKFRPWKPEEVPLGRVVRIKGKSPAVRILLLETNGNGEVYLSNRPVKTTELLASFELEMPDGSTVPCGIEETNGQG